MHSSNFYRNYGSSTSPYKAPSKSANTFESSIGGGGHNRSRSNLHDIASTPYDETWPLDEVINKIDIKSDSEDDFGVYGGGNRSGGVGGNGGSTAAHQHYPWRSSSPGYFNSSRYNNNNSSALNSDRVYSAFPESKPTWSSSRQLRPSSGAGFSSPLYKSSYDTNNNYLNSEDSDTLSEDDFEGGSSSLLRDVGIQCNLKKYSSPVKSAAIELPITIVQQQPLNSSSSNPANLSQKPPIKVIKSSTNGFVSAYSDVPKLVNNKSSGNFADSSSPYAALDFDQSHDTDYRPTPEPTNDAIYSQVDKSRTSSSHRPPSANSNINIIYKQPLNESISSYRSMADGKVYDVKTKDYGFSVATNPNAPRFNLSNPMTGALSNSGVYMGSGSTPTRSSYHNTTNGSYRDLHDIPLTPVPVVEKEIIEETISISNASTEDSNIPPYNSRAQPTMDRLTVADASRGGGGNNSRGQQQQPYGDNLSFTSKTSSNYRRESPVRPSYGGSSLSKQSPFSTMETKKKPLKKKKGVLSSGKNDENVLLANNSLRLKSSRGSDSNSSRVQPSERLYKSNADLRDQWLREETRGGLAAAYNRRQPYSGGSSVVPQSNSQQTTRQRALSLNRMNAAFDEDGERGNSYNSYNHHHHQQQPPPPHHLLPTRYHSQTHLNGGGTSSRLSDNSSYHRGGHHRTHERDPIVMYIPPTVNHRPGGGGGDQPKLTSILRNNSTKSSTVLGGTLPSKKKAAAAAAKESKSQSKTNLKEAAAKEKEKEKAAAAAAKKKADLNRRHSMPKDAKLNGASGSWFSKFKLKSNK